MEVRHKRGDIREDGKIFWRYEKTSPNGEYWVDSDKFVERRASESRRAEAHYEANKDAIRGYKSAYHEANKDYIREWKANYQKANKDALRERRADYYVANRDAILERNAAYKEANLDAARERDSAYRRSDQGRAAKKARHDKRYKEDPLYALTCRVRGRLRAALRGTGYTKNSKTAEIIGCSYEELRTHIESQFTGGMCWERFSEIHIDHITPIALATNEEEMLALNHYTNLQPLWAIDNLKKGAKW